MKKLATYALILSFLVSGASAVPGVSYAQNAQGTYNQGTTDETGAGGTTTNQQTTTANDDNGNNWWWLLPLLAIPVIYLMTRRSKEPRQYRDERYAVGAKGGRSARRDDDEDNDR